MNIIITGASSGIGYNTAKKFAETGDHTVLALSRNEKKLHELSMSVEKGRIVPVVMDLAKYTYSKLIETITALGINHIDILIHNAGQLVNKPFTELEVREWESIYATNVIGVAQLTRSIMQKMGGDEHTHIVTIGSMGGVGGTSKFPGLSAYSSSKGALAILTECMAEEFKGKNISANCLALGAVQTEMLKKAFPGYSAKMTTGEISDYIYDFSVGGWRYFNGKTLPVSTTNP